VYIITTRDYNRPAATNAKPIRLSEHISFKSAQLSHLAQERRPLVLLYGWLGAKPAHLQKFGYFYECKGFDVLYVQITPMQVVRPGRAQSVITMVTDFITEESRKNQPILFHGFSVGGYVYGETMFKFKSDPAKFSNMKDRVKGQVFDSIVQLPGIPTGVSNAVTMDPILNKTIKFSLETYLRLFEKSVMQYFRRASVEFHENPLRIPSLMFYSTNDVTVTAESLENASRGWRKRGVPVTERCWDDSPHVQHFRYHPVEYIHMLNQFLTSIKLQSEIENTPRRQSEAEDSDDDLDSVRRPSRQRSSIRF